MFTTEMVSFLQSGCALVVGTVGEDGVPLASRGWGLDVDAGERSARLLLPAVDPALRNTISRDSRIAVTATNVRTLRSVQLKGLVRDVEPVTEADRDDATDPNSAAWERRCSMSEHASPPPASINMAWVNTLPRS